MSEEELVGFDEDELEFLEGLFGIIGVFASLSTDNDKPITLHVDISTENNLVDISVKGEADDNRQQ